MKFILLAIVFSNSIFANPLVINLKQEPRRLIFSAYSSLIASSSAMFYAGWKKEILPLILEKLPEKLFRIFSGNQNTVERQRRQQQQQTPPPEETFIAVPNGMETLSFEEGRFYLGNVRNGQPWGQGTMFYPDGTKHKGGWFDGLKNGQGTFYPNPGSLIESLSGVWQDDMLDDSTRVEILKRGVFRQGTDLIGPVQISLNKAEFSDFSVQERERFQQLDFLEGDRYVGPFEGNMPNYLPSGVGVIYFTNSDIYTGPINEYVEPHGENGIMIFSGNETYRGSWENGQRHGLGSTQFLSGTLVHSSWENDIEGAGRGIITLSEGVRYEGFTAEGQPYGDGYLIYPNGFSEIVYVDNGRIEHMDNTQDSSFEERFQDEPKSNGNLDNSFGS